MNSFYRGFFGELEKIAFHVKAFPRILKKMQKGSWKIKTKKLKDIYSHDPLGGQMGSTLLPGQSGIKALTIKAKGGLIGGLLRSSSKQVRDFVKTLSPKAKELANRVAEAHESFEIAALRRKGKPFIDPYFRQTGRIGLKKNIMGPTTHMEGVLAREANLLKKLKGPEAKKVQKLFKLFRRDVYAVKPPPKSFIRPKPLSKVVLENPVALTGSQMKARTSLNPFEYETHALKWLKRSPTKRTPYKHSVVESPEELITRVRGKGIS